MYKVLDQQKNMWIKCLENLQSSDNERNLENIKQPFICLGWKIQRYFGTVSLSIIIIKVKWTAICCHMLKVKLSHAMATYGTAESSFMH